MKRENDKVIFEYRQEIVDVLNALETYMKEHPKAAERESVERLDALLDRMEMEW